MGCANVIELSIGATRQLRNLAIVSTYLYLHPQSLQPPRVPKYLLLGLTPQVARIRTVYANVIQLLLGATRHRVT